MDFMGNFEDFGLKVGIYTHLNEVMKNYEYKRSMSVFDF